MVCIHMSTGQALWTYLVTDGRKVHAFTSIAAIEADCYKRLLKVSIYTNKH